LRREKRDESTTTAAAMGECAPLLQQRVAARDGWEEKHCDDDRDGARWWTDLAQEGGKVWRVALPMAAVSLSQYAVQVASNMMVGHLPGVLPLSASAIATSLATVSGFSLLVRELFTISFSTCFNFSVSA
jgi:multidrug resistance protein, MATE family